MKKVFTILAVAMMSLAMVSCGGEKSPLDKAEALVEKMEKAAENKDVEALEALYEELEAIEIDEDALSEEEQEQLQALGMRVMGIMFATMGM